ncbi:hypothetical protein HY409_01680 [Candidatus Gottesmanbacteria bacterium]|nr:hypothetical protein [Candidatus Gottesmanbacteria bacterium]
MYRVLAQSIQLPGDNGPVPITGIPGFKYGDVGSIVTGAIPFVIAFAGFGLLLMLIRAGYSFLTSAGDAKKLEEGKQRLTNAIVGFVVIFVAYWMVILIGKIFGVVEIQSIFK